MYRYPARGFDRVASIRAALAVMLVTLLGTAHPALAQSDDFALAPPAWNSLSDFVGIAEDRGLQVEHPERLDIGTLSVADTLVIVHPDERPPASALAAFLRAGGRIVLADDFGAGQSLLSIFSIGRGDPDVEQSLLLRGNPSLLVARPVGNHRLTQGVSALVTNHPSTVYHRELSPIFEMAEGDALVLAGAVGEGRLVVLSDPSALIDNMLQLQGNRRFAENLLDYLTEGRGGRVYLIEPDAQLVGRFGEPGADRPLHDLRQALESAANVSLPPLALRIGSLALTAIALILALGTLPRRSPYRVDRMFARAPAQGGFVGRVGFFSRRDVNLMQPLMVYKFELEAALLARLGLSGRALLKDVLGAMRKRGIPEPDVLDTRSLLLELDQLRDLEERPPGPPRIRPSRFRALVSRGERLLELITPETDRP